MTSPLRALIVDDELPARRALSLLLSEIPDVEVAATASNGMEALAALAADGGINLLLLDIEMPALAGMELAMRLDPAIAPVLVFVTAYPRYAADAFDVGATDYLLKPVDPQRLALAIARAREHLQARSGQQRIAALVASLEHLRARPITTDIDHVWVELARGCRRVELREIEWFAADGDYVQAHVGGRSYLMRDSLTRLEAALPGAGFVRIHRSTIVNIAAVTRVVRADSGQLLLRTRSGMELKVGRRTRSRVRHLFGKPR